MLLEKSSFICYFHTMEEAEAEKEKLLKEDPTKELTILIRTDRVHNKEDQ